MGIRTNLSTNRYDGVLYYSWSNLLLVPSLQPCRMIVCLFRLVDGCVVVRVTLLSTERDGSWEMESSSPCGPNVA